MRNWLRGGSSYRLSSENRERQYCGQADCEATVFPSVEGICDFPANNGDVMRKSWKYLNYLGRHMNQTSLWNHVGFFSDIFSWGIQ